MIKKVLAIFLVCAMITGLLPAAPMAVAAAGDVKINEANFPDANFRAYVKETFDTAENGGEAGDDWLTAAEIGKITGIYCVVQEIESLKGIEHFTALTELHCSGNQLTKLDVSKNTALTDLDCARNQLTNLDVSKNTALERLYCDHNQLASLDVSKNTELTFLICSGNKLTNLDVSKNTELTLLFCADNQLTSLDVSKNADMTHLWCEYNQLTSLDVSKNTALTELYCSDNKLTSLDLSENTYLTDATISQIFGLNLDVRNSAGKYVVDLKQLDENIDISRVKMTDGGSLSAEGKVTYDSEPSKITYQYDTKCPAQSTPMEVTIYIVAAVELSPANFPDDNFRAYLEETFDTADNGGVAGDGWLTTQEVCDIARIYCGYQGISDLTGIEHFPMLTYLNCYGNQLTKLDVSKNTALTDLDCARNQLASLDVSKNRELTFLHCSYNQLTSLDVRKNTELTSLICSGNKLTSLDVSKNTALTWLDCSSNSLTSLDVSKNADMPYLLCEYNQLTSLDVSKNTALKGLSCSWNQLTSLDVSKNTALTELYCSDNQLTSLDLSKNTELKTALYHAQTPKIELVVVFLNGKYVVNLKEIDENIDLNRIVMTDGGIINKYGEVEYDSKPEKVMYNYQTMSPDSGLMDVTIKTNTAYTITVTFDANGHGTAPAAMTVLYGEKFAAPTPEPSETGWTFGGWYKEAECKTAWDFEKDTVKENITLYAKWTEKEENKPQLIIVSGKIISYGDAAEKTKLELQKVGENGIFDTAEGTTSYTFGKKIPAGTYTMTVSKPNHATREYTIKIGSEAPPDVAIYLLGDVDMSGELNMLDIQKIFAFIKNSSSITDEYQKKLADVDENKIYNMLDIQCLFNAIKEA